MLTCTCETYKLQQVKHEQKHVSALACDAKLELKTKTIIQDCNEPFLILLCKRYFFAAVPFCMKPGGTKQY